MDKRPQIEEMIEQESAPGRSPGAVARELCGTLGCLESYPLLKDLLEELLADGNKASFDRSAILADFDAAAPKDAAEARHRSFCRNNPGAPIAAGARSAHALQGA
jgi:hypothetical protein